MNPYEVQNRTAKAIKIANTIERYSRTAVEEGMSEWYSRMLDRMDLAPNDFRTLVSNMAEVNFPSEATWAEAVGYLRERHAYNLTMRAARAMV